MLALAFRHGSDPSALQIDRQTSGAVQKVAVGLEPSGLTGSRKPPVGNDEVGQIAGGGELALLDALPAPADQHVPGPAAALQDRRAEVGIAPGTGPVRQGDDFAGHPGEFGQRLGGEGIPALTQ
jgi:hypothetical protein